MHIVGHWLRVIVITTDCKATNHRRVQVRRRKEGGYGSYPECVLALRVSAAEAHLALGRLEEAEAALQKLAGQSGIAEVEGKAC